MDFLADIGRMNKRQFLLQTINLGAAAAAQARRLRSVAAASPALCRPTLAPACIIVVPTFATLQA